MKVKGIFRQGWHRVDKSYVTLAKTNIDGVDFYIAGTYFEKINDKKIIQVCGKDVCILDDKYIWITIIPIGKNYAITINIDKDDNILQWYFDITLKNYLGENGMPYFKDLYIDVTYDISGEITILDEDELKEALNNNDITEEEYDFAIIEADYIIENLKSRREELLKFSDEWVKKFSKRFRKEEINLVDNHGNKIYKKNQVKKYIKPGMRVKIVLKKDQPTGILTEGIVKRILTNSRLHHRGIKVMLEDGQVGRVQEIID